MDMSELSEEEKQERIKKELEFRAKKRNSRIFLLAGSIFEIVETIALIIALFLLFIVLIIKVFHFKEQTAQTLYQISTVVSFIGGLILGFFIYRACANFVIEKFKLHDKLTDEVINHYSKRAREAQKEAMKR
jgi:hypothetical protein